MTIKDPILVFLYIKISSFLNARKTKLTENDGVEKSTAKKVDNVGQRIAEDGTTYRIVPKLIGSMKGYWRKLKISFSRSTELMNSNAWNICQQSDCNGF